MADAPDLPPYDYFCSKLADATKGLPPEATSAFESFAISLPSSVFDKRPKVWVDMFIKQARYTLEESLKMSTGSGAFGIVVNQLIHRI